MEILSTCSISLLCIFVFLYACNSIYYAHENSYIVLKLVVLQQILTQPCIATSVGIEQNKMNVYKSGQWIISEYLRLDSAQRVNESAKHKQRDV